MQEAGVGNLIDTGALMGKRADCASPELFHILHYCRGWKIHIKGSSTNTIRKLENQTLK